MKQYWVQQEGLLVIFASQYVRTVQYRTLPPPVSRLSRQCGILNISQPYRPPQPDTGIAVIYLPLIRPVCVTIVFCAISSCTLLDLNAQIIHLLIWFFFPLSPFPAVFILYVRMLHFIILGTFWLMSLFSSLQKGIRWFLMHVYLVLFTRFHIQLILACWLEVHFLVHIFG
jgi:hypothetical protein